MLRSHGSIFSGIGGFDFAAKIAGISTLWQIENDPFCRRVLEKNFSEAKKFGDIKDVNEKKLQPVDVISAGMPCQPFSRAGKQRGAADDRFLWQETFRIIRHLRPHWVIFENVDGIINLAIDALLSDMEAETYTCQSFVIPACGINAWHRRYRVFIIAYSPGNGRQKGMSITKSLGKTVEKWSKKIESKRLFERNWNRWSSEPGVDRVAYGIPNRVDRCRGLGNAIVPQIAYILFKTIKAIEE